MEWAPEFEVDEVLARRLIAGQFPQFATARMTRFGAGMDNIAYLVDGRYVFRFPRRGAVVHLLEREERILPLIANRLPLPVPFPAFIGKSDLGYPSTFAGYGRLDGTSACSVSLTAGERALMAAPLGNFLRALHAIEPEIGESAELPGDELGRLDHAKRFPLAQDRFAQLRDAGLVQDSSVFLDFLAAHAPGSARAAHRIVHGDLYARHVLVDEQHRICGIIDWGDVHLGDPALDLMVAHSMLPAQAHEEFIRAYGGVDEQTWMLAKYRAVYHCALVAYFGMRIADAALRDAGLTGLAFIKETLRSI